MLKSMIVASGIALAALAVTPSAEAHSNSGFSIYFGIPFYSYRVGPEWRYYDGYGWYDYRRHGDFRGRVNNRLTCNQARRLVDRSGYNRVQVRECNGRTYTFRAVRNGKQFTVYVNSRTGGVWRG